jgi:hypothetical protein
MAQLPLSEGPSRGNKWRHVVRNEIKGRLSKFVNFVITLLVICGTCGVALAEEQRTGGPTPSPEGAAVHFIDLKDGATIPTKVTIRFGLREMGVAPAGSDRANSGHHHLLVDTELPPLDQPIPNDFNHLHFGAGQTEAEITLKPGTHTAAALGGQGPHSTQPAGHVSPHSRPCDGRGNSPERSRIGGTHASHASPEYSKTLSFLSTSPFLLTACNREA